MGLNNKMKNQEKLFEKYPGLFFQKDLPMQQTCMCWGVECGEGWYGVLERLCEKLSKYSEEKGLDIQFVQIKEKYGELRVYLNYYDDEVDKMTEEAENEADNTCEICSAKGELSIKFGWYKTLCEECRKKNDYKLIIQTTTEEND